MTPLFPTVPCDDRAARFQARNLFPKFNLNISGQRVSIWIVRWLTSIAMFVLLGAWLAASNHCYLEAAGILPDDCPPTEQSSASKSDPCENDCKLVEKSDYKNQDNERFTICAVLLPVIFQTALQNEPAPNPPVQITAWPPETLHLPQFVASTSLPVRAPSFVS